MTHTIPRLHLISDRALCPLDHFVSVAAAVVAAGVHAVHLRERDLPAGDLLDLARRLRSGVGDRAAVIVNDRLDVALVARADGVQLPERGLSVRDARSIVGDRLLVGCSVHDAGGAARAAAEGADYVLAGNVYASRSKPGMAGRGPGFIADVAATARLPVIALGGVTAERVPEVMAAGAAGIAVISAILAARDPSVAAADLRNAVDAAWEQGVSCR